jgi:SAM-dependent methyltransferase
MGTIYNKVFASVYDSFMHRFERGLFKKRKYLLGHLTGNILEVGSGTGVNFKFYAPDLRVLAVEPSAAMIKIAKTKVTDQNNIEFLNFGVTDRKIDNHIPEKSLDAIVSTLVMCTIPNPHEAVANFKKWLKPGGKLIVLEHIHASRPFNRKFQTAFNPIWKTFGEGCNLTRNTDELIKGAGFKALHEEYFVRLLRFHAGVFVLDE